MVCEMCKQRDAMVHLTQRSTEFALIEGIDPDSVDPDSVPHKELGQTEQHFCEECADKYFASTPGMNSSRDLICLSDAYRAKLLDKLEAELPEAFYDGEDHRRWTEITERQRKFLRNELDREGIEVNADGFDMLWTDLFVNGTFTIDGISSSEALERIRIKIQKL